jgi:hypothetical protein
MPAENGGSADAICLSAKAIQAVAVYPKRMKGIQAGCSGKRSDTVKPFLLISYSI